MVPILIFAVVVLAVYILFSEEIKAVQERDPAAKNVLEIEKILKEIKSGKFAREWIAENETGRKNFDRLLSEGDKHPIEEIGKQLREMMPWMKH